MKALVATTRAGSIAATAITDAFTISRTVSGVHIPKITPTACQNSALTVTPRNFTPALTVSLTQWFPWNSPQAALNTNLESTTPPL